MLDVTCLFKGTLHMSFLCILHIKEGVSVKCQHSLRCCIGGSSLANQRLIVTLCFLVQATEVRTEMWKNTFLGRAAPLVVALMWVPSQLHLRPPTYQSS